MNVLISNISNGRWTAVLRGDDDESILFGNRSFPTEERAQEYAAKEWPEVAITTE